MDKPKRKTKTSTAVKARYNKKTYEQIVVSVPKATAQAFKEKCRATGVPQAQVVKAAIADFLGEDKNYRADAGVY